YVLIDCPPSLGFLTFNAIRAANEVIIPVETSTFAIMGVSKLVSMVELIKLKLHHSPVARGLVTMYDPMAEFSQKMLGKIKNMFQDKILKTVISFDIAFREAQEKFLPIFEHNSDTDGARDYLNLADEIINHEKENLPESIYKELHKILYSNVFSKEKAFSFHAPEAREVHVVGDFNNWEVGDDSLLSRMDNGLWERRYYLMSGHYRYKFVVDGLYFGDPENPSMEPDPYGNYDSVFDL
ncbi:MAG: AAA family ATPase, partial [Candidatus Omnitrophota bacterium]